MSTNEVLHLRRVVPNTVKPSPTRNRLETDAIPITIGAAWVTKSSLPKRVKDRADRLDPISVCARRGNELPNVTAPKVKNDDPNRAKERSDKVLAA